MRPSIYVGLGGTGIRAIAQTKKLYEDVYGKGNIPKCIAFLAVDFNLKDVENPSLATSMKDDAVFIPFSGSPRLHYAERRPLGDYQWMFDSNTKSLADKITEELGIDNIKINYVGPVIGTHSGPGTIALFFVGTER